jgi:hypothetical protein
MPFESAKCHVAQKVAVSHSPRSESLGDADPAPVLGRIPIRDQFPDFVFVEWASMLACESPLRARVLPNRAHGLKELGVTECGDQWFKR